MCLGTINFTQEKNSSDIIIYTKCCQSFTPKCSSSKTSHLHQQSNARSEGWILKGKANKGSSGGYARAWKFRHQDGAVQYIIDRTTANVSKSTKELWRRQDTRICHSPLFSRRNGKHKTHRRDHQGKLSICISTTFPT